MTGGVYSLECEGEQLLALPEKALYWPAQKTLFVADLHLGKGAAFRAAAYPVPEGSTASTLAKLSCLIESLDVSRVVLLGDLWHSKWGRDAGMRDRFASWLLKHRGVEMLLAVGNHDARSGDLEAEGLVVSSDPIVLGPFLCAHHPQELVGGYVLSGHIHPSVALEGKARQSVRLPCFWFCDRYAVLPAFGELTGTATVAPCKTDSVLVIADGRVISVGKAGRPKAN
ncbi:MAG: ligase-associated DNA damage response endonuclease PdeM [Fimbriimonas sp.]